MVLFLLLQANGMVEKRKDDVCERICVVADRTGRQSPEMVGIAGHETPSPDEAITKLASCGGNNLRSGSRTR